MTICNTPLLTPLLRLLALAGFRLGGWTLDTAAAKPPYGPCVLTAAPHTSNWDFLLMICGILILRIRVRWFGKHTLFRFPFGPLMRYMGGIAIDRTRNTNVVSSLVTEFTRDPELILIIAAEGTRRKVDRWRSGFYHIAREADVPVMLVAIDGLNRNLRFLGAIEATEADPENALAAIDKIRRDWFEDIQGVKRQKP